MHDLAEFLTGLFHEGKISFRTRPLPPTARAVPPGVPGVLEAAYAAYRLDIAGPPPALDVGVAAAAAELVRQASWALVCRQDQVEDLGRRLTMPHGPATPAHHLSADLILRY